MFHHLDHLPSSSASQLAWGKCLVFIESVHLLSCTSDSLGIKLNTCIYILLLFGCSHSVLPSFFFLNNHFHSPPRLRKLFTLLFSYLYKFFLIFSFLFFFSFQANVTRNEDMLNVLNRGAQSNSYSVAVE